MHLAGGLRRLEPLDPGGARTCRVGDAHLRGGLRQRHLERGAEDRVRFAEGERRLCPVGTIIRQLNGDNREVAGVEPQGGAGPLDHPLHVQRGRTVEGAPVEPYVPVEVEVPDDHLVRVGE